MPAEKCWGWGFRKNIIDMVLCQDNGLSLGRTTNRRVLWLLPGLTTDAATERVVWMFVSGASD